MNTLRNQNQKQSKSTQENKHDFPEWKFRLHEIIFEADTPLGKLFDIVLLIAIVISIVVVMLESVQEINSEIGLYLRIVEWIITVLFTIEYFARIVSIGKPLKYIFSFMGLIDFLAIIPTYLGLVFSGSRYFLIIRTFRLLRVFRIFKLARYLGEAQGLLRAVKESIPKIAVFSGFVLAIEIVMGTLMYFVEGGQNNFTSIPRSIYWAIVTMTTVGYGDIAPKTVLGQTLASIIMMMGYAIIAVPTGIVAVGIQRKNKVTTQSCPQCSREGHDHDAIYCKYCSSLLN